MTTPQNGYGSQPATTTVPASGKNTIDALLSLVKWGGVLGQGASLSYSFPFSSSLSATWSTNTAYSTVKEPSTAYGLSPIEQAAAESALRAWSNVASLSFAKTDDSVGNVGTIRFAWTGAVMNNSVGVPAHAWGYYPSSYYAQGGDVWLSKSAFQNDKGFGTEAFWQDRAYGQYLLQHELGHALGLDHSFEGNAVLPASEESRKYSIMSYTAHPNSLIVSPLVSGLYTYSYVYPDTPMLYDVAAIQYLYGANMTYKTGDDTYTFDPATPFIRTIWDAGGRDTISVANFAKACTIDLQPGHYSKISIETPSSAGISWTTPPKASSYDGTDNLAIAYGVTIENAIGGAGNDTITGNSANNLIDGGPGIDTVIYLGNKSNYSVAKITAGYRVTDASGKEGVDTLTNVERIQYADKTIALDISANAGQVYRVYQAALNRQPDQGGLGDWIYGMDKGMSLTDVANGFIGSPEFKALYGENPSTAEFVNRLYQNVLHRAATIGLISLTPEFNPGPRCWPDLAKALRIRRRSSGRLAMDSSTPRISGEVAWHGRTILGLLPRLDP